MDQKILFSRLQFKGKIHLISSNEEISAVAKSLRGVGAFGFDTETRASFKKGEVYKVALLQLATEQEAFLIRLQHISHFELFASIFECRDTLKVGLAIRDDLKALQKIFSFAPENCVDLQTIAKQKGLKNMGLRGLTEEVLQATLSKKAKISNWELRSLSEEQIIYAATDAWISLKIYQQLDVNTV
jgi:ribonuclease D